MFPPLIEQGDPAMLEVVGRLQQDHLQMESRWVRARSVLAAVAAGASSALSADDEAALDAFASLCAGHIKAEEAIAYPAAAASLDAEAVAAMGREMMRRRGTAWRPTCAEGVRLTHGRDRGMHFIQRRLALALEPARLEPQLRGARACVRSPIAKPGPHVVQLKIKIFPPRYLGRDLVQVVHA